MASAFAERWAHIRVILEAALELTSPDEQAAYIAEACGDDAELRTEVEELLRAEAEASRWLAQPIQDVAGDLIEAAQHAIPWSDSLIGTPIGPYRLVRKLGEGGMGVVFLAEREAFQQAVAIKLMRPGYDTPVVVSRFLAERQILATLSHPNIARLLDGGLTAEGRPFFVMEYVEGEPIDQYCRTHQLSIQARLDLFCTVCEAVQYAHQNLVVHRDLKPSNILVTEDGRVKLLDFGIAKVLDAGGAEAVGAGPLTRTGQRIMTPEYASPEQVRGEPITTSSDVYALGVLLYELLTGQRPYQISSRLEHEVARIILEEEPTRPSTAITTAQPDASPTGTTTGLSMAQLQRRLRGDLDTIVLMALRKETARRYRSVEQFTEDIRRHLSGLPVQAQRDTWGYRAQKFIQRHRTGVGAAALAVTAVLAGLTVAVWQGQRAAHERDVAQQEAAKAQQVSAFMMEFFKSADPYQQKGDSLLARDVLDAGVGQTETQLADQPEVQAAIYDVLGNTYWSLGNRAQADTLFQRALERRQTVYDEGALEMASSWFYLGWLRHAQSRYEEAQGYLQKAIDTQQRYLDSGDPVLGLTYHRYGELINDMGQLDEGERYYNRALANLEPHAPQYRMEIARVLLALGGLYRSRNQVTRADSVVRRAVALQVEEYGPDHLYVGRAMSQWASIKKAQDSVEVAVGLLRQAIKIHEAAYGPDSGMAAKSELARILQGRGQYEQADSLMQLAYGYYVRTFGAEHRFSLIMMNNRANLRFDQGKLEEAKGMYEEVIRGKEALLGRVHWSTTVSLYGYARLLHDMELLDDAERQYREVVDIRRELYPKGHHTTGFALNALGQLLLEQRRSEAAEPVFREALGLLQAFTDSLDWRQGVSQSGLGAALSNQSRYAEADSLLRTGYDLIVAKRGTSGLYPEQARERLAAHYTAWGRPEDAARYAEPPEN